MTGCVHGNLWDSCWRCLWKMLRESEARAREAVDLSHRLLLAGKWLQDDRDAAEAKVEELKAEAKRRHGVRYEGELLKMRTLWLEAEASRTAAVGSLKTAEGLLAEWKKEASFNPNWELAIRTEAFLACLNTVGT